MWKRSFRKLPFKGLTIPWLFKVFLCGPSAALAHRLSITHGCIYSRDAVDKLALCYWALKSWHTVYTHGGVGGVGEPDCVRLFFFFFRTAVCLFNSNKRARILHHSFICLCHHLLSAHAPVNTATHPLRGTHLYAYWGSRRWRGEGSRGVLASSQVEPVRHTAKLKKYSRNSRVCVSVVSGPHHFACIIAILCRIYGIFWNWRLL